MRALVVTLALTFFGVAIADHADLTGLQQRKLMFESFARKVNENAELRNSSVIDLLTDSATKLSSNVSAGCLDATMSWIKGLKGGELWALRMVDAAGKLPISGMLVGNLFAFGSFWECVNTSQPVVTNGVRGQYCTATMALANQTNVLLAILNFKWGVCVPDACNATDLSRFIQLVVSSGGAIPYVGKALGAIEVVDTTCQLNDLQLTGLAISGIFVACVFVIIVLVATSYDTLFWYSNGHVNAAFRAFLTRFTESPFKVSSNNAVESNSDQALLISNQDESSQSNSNVQLPMVVNLDLQSDVVRVQRVEKGLLGKCVSSFSVRLNGAAIFSTKSSSDQLDCLHGMRFLSMVWIITGHVYSWSVGSPLDLFLAYDHYVNSWTFQVIWNGFFSVDTFFVISGLLTTYVSLRYISRVDNVRKFKWHLFYAHRYLRLTPVYGILIFLYVGLYPYMSNGPQWNQKTDEACQDYWWTNLLYINNFYNTTAQCFGHTWYLANDMQFFVISPLVIVPLCIAPVFGVSVILLLVAVGVVSTSVITTVNNFSAVTMKQVTGNQLTMDSLGPITEFNDIYTKPYCRVGAYAIGMLVGYILFRTKRKITLNAWHVLFAWLTSTALALSVLFCLYDATRGVTTLTTAQSAAYLAWSRIAWSISIGWVIFACATGYGGWVNRFLSWKVFAPLSRLTYCAYLVHPLILTILIEYWETAIDIREFPVFYYVSGNVVLSYAMALLLSLVFEAPFLGLEKLIFGRD